jgi:ATP-dependent Clp protease ATP-binding subunit ClpC
MTTNVGADVIKRQVTLGFGAMGGGDENYANMRDKILERAKEAFKPEFLNRLDEKIVFHVLDRENLIQIVDLEINTVVKRLAGKNIHLKLDKEAKEFLIEQGYDPNYGARPMRRAVERHIEDPLAEHLLRGDIAPGHTVKITHTKDEKYLSFRPVGADESETDEAVEPVIEPVNSAEG